MALSLQRLLDSGESAYITKHNANYAAIESALNTLGSQVASGPLAAATLPHAFLALFGLTPGVFGPGSFSPTIDYETGMTIVQPGFAWVPHRSQVVRSILTDEGIEISALGQPAGLIYLNVDSVGMPYWTNLQSTYENLYRVNCLGGTGGFELEPGSLVRLANILWAAPEWIAAQGSGPLGAFETLDLRLDAIEGSISAPVFLASGFAAGVPANAALMFVVMPPTGVTVTFPVNFANSRAKAGVAATAETILSIKKNGVEVGTITFAAAGTTGTFAAASEVEVTGTDELTIENQATADATLRDVRFALHGTR